MPRKPKIIAFTCESCGAEHTGPAGFSTEGMCPICGRPMRIDDLFGDRRSKSWPVPRERRSPSEPEEP